MGRGRAKAKQTKVARELKYASSGTDLDALQAELAQSSSQSSAPSSDSESADDTTYEYDEDND
ncbi:MAG: DUF3073 domain-containing protein [Actinomycetes bacterium]